MSEGIRYQIAEGIRARAEEIARIESRNVGKPIRDSRDEVAAACFEYYPGAVTNNTAVLKPASWSPLSALLLGEALRGSHLVGGAVVLLGVFLTTRR